MLRLERIDSPVDTLRAAMQGHQAGVWTALPAIIQSFDAAAMTCTAQPAIKAQVRGIDGAWSDVAMPLLVDVPVIFPSGGGFTLTFPIVAGDEALIVFASRCIDAWWQSGGVQVQAELRMHDLSDGFSLVGPRSQVRTLPGVSTSTVQLRSDDGAAFVEIAGGHVCNITAPGGINLTTSGQITLTAAEVALVTPVIVGGVPGVTSTATFGGAITATGDIVGNGVSLDAHHHTGVQPGGGNTGGPV